MEFVNLAAKIIRKNIVVILIAIILGLIAVLPHILFSIDSGNNYQGIDIETGDAEFHFLARIQEVYEGNLSLGNAFIKEFKDQRYLMPPLPEMIVAGIGKVLFLSPNEANILGKFIFVSILFYVIYLIAFKITNNKLYSILVSLGALFYLDIIYAIQTNFSRANMFQYSRPLNPALSSIFLFLFFYIWLKYLENKKKIFMFSAGIIFGLTFYFNFYLWTFILAFMFFESARMLLFGKKKMLLGLAVMIFIAGVVSLPYFYNLFQASQISWYGQASERMGLVKSRQFFDCTLLNASFLFFLISLFFRKIRTNKYIFFVISIFLASYVSLNQQIISGVMIQPNHYYWNIIAPFCAIITAILFYELIKTNREKRIFKIIIIFGIFLVLLFGTYNQIFAYQNNKQIAFNNQKYGGLINWMKNNVDNQSVIYSDNKTSLFIAAYSEYNIYYNQYAMYYLIPFDRINNALFLEYKLKDINPEQFKKLIFTEDRPKVSGFLYGLYYRGKTGNYANIPDYTLNNIYHEYEIYYKSDIKKQIEESGINILICDTNEYDCAYDKYPFLKQIAIVNNFVIYNVKN